MSWIMKKSAPAKTHSMMALQKDLNEFFETMLKDTFVVPSDLSAGFSPSMEIKEDEKSYKIVAEIPGMSEEDIHLTLRDNTLVLEGEKKSETVKEEKGYFKSEIAYGQFYREVPFASEVDPEKITANYKDGVLTVEVDKSVSHAKKVRKIDVRKG